MVQRKVCSRARYSLKIVVLVVSYIFDGGETISKHREHDTHTLYESCILI